MKRLTLRTPASAPSSSSSSAGAIEVVPATPGAMGFDPARFPAWHSIQKQSLEAVLRSPYRTSVLCAPTGAGKSLIAAALVRYYALRGLRCVILTATKALQDQYTHDDFPFLQDIRGMCVGPDTRVLTADLRWVKAEEIAAGQELAGFEENGRVGYRRRWEKATVLSAQKVTRPSYKLEFESGAVVVCSVEHRWLTKTNHDGSGNDVWMTAKDLKVNLHCVKRPLDPWREPNDYNSGWLAAAWDGEGSLSYMKNKRGEGWMGAQLGFVQTSCSPMLQEFKDRLAALNLPASYTTRVTYAEHKKYHRAETLVLTAQRAWLTALGKTRPKRLLAKLDWSKVGGLTGAGDRLVRKTFIGTTEVIALTTSTGTFIAEGLASHNSNYACQALKKRELRVSADYYTLPPTFDNGPCHQGVECWRKGALVRQCDGLVALDEARASSMVVTNYAMFLTGSLGAFDLVIADEAHLIKGQLDNYGRLEHPAMPDLAPAATRRWAQRALEDTRGMAPSRKTEIERARLSALAAMPNDYIKDTDAKGVVSWVPLKPRMEELTSRAKRLVLLSATVTEAQVADLMSVCVPPVPWTYKAFPPVFAAQNRRVLLLPALDPETKKPIALKYNTTVAAKAEHMAHSVRLLKALLAQGYKGIVHTVSYDRAREFSQAATAAGLGAQMFYPTPRNLASTVEAFKLAPAPAFLVSPSVGTGYDFPYDLCRWQIVLKVPFADSRNALAKARAALDADYSVREAMSTLEQIAGRGTRNRNDWCETYVLDQSLVWAKKHASNALKSAIVEIDTAENWFKRRGVVTMYTPPQAQKAGSSSSSSNISRPGRVSLRPGSGSPITRITRIPLRRL